jgi:predicted membrane channel-forming protein YqfA (hemolysin III family)
VLLAGQWIAALLGSIFATCSDLNAPSTTLIELVIFVCMGFGLVLVWPIIAATLSSIAIRLLLLGGAAYVVGIIFFVLGEYKPIYHTIWHLFVVLGASLHWFDIYFYISSTQLTNMGMGEGAGASGVAPRYAYPECLAGSGPGPGFSPGLVFNSSSV